MGQTMMEMAMDIYTTYINYIVYLFPLYIDIVWF